MLDSVREIEKDLPVFLKKIKPICESYKISNKTAILELLRFLDLISFHKTPLSPSYPVDLVWHEFILFTKYYHNFCNKKYGRYIHHTPSDKSSPSLYLKTLQLYTTTFGKPSEDLWPGPSDAWNEIECGGCIN